MKWVTHSVPDGPSYDARDVDDYSKPAAAEAQDDGMGNHPKSNINTLHVRYVVLKAVALSAIWCNGSKSNLGGA